MWKETTSTSTGQAISPNPILLPQDNKARTLKEVMRLAPLELVQWMIITIIVLLRQATHLHKGFAGNRVNIQPLALLLQQVRRPVMLSLLAMLSITFLTLRLPLLITINYSCLLDNTNLLTAHPILTDVNMVTLLVEHRVSAGFVLLYFSYKFSDHTATSHDQGPSSYGQPYEPLHDPYAAYQPHHTQQHLTQSAYLPDPYAQPFVSHTPLPRTLSTDGYYPPINTSPPPIHQPQPLHGERNYTLGGDGYGISGDGYGGNQLPTLPERAPTLPGSAPYVAYGQQQQPPSIDTNVGPGYATGQPLHLSPVNEPVPNEAPPGYEPSAPGGVVGNWGKR